MIYSIIKLLCPMGGKRGRKKGLKIEPRDYIVHCAMILGSWVFINTSCSSGLFT
jgi:hypothetical protein